MNNSDSRFTRRFLRLHGQSREKLGQRVRPPISTNTPRWVSEFRILGRVIAYSDAFLTKEGGTNMGLDDENKKGEASGETSDRENRLSRMNSESSLSEEDEERKPELGPMIALKEQLEKDKDDESLRRWKEQLIGVVDFEDVGETPDPVVKILHLTVRSPDREEMVLTIPDDGVPNPKGPWFTIKEGSKYTLVFNFRVTNNIVSGLRYNNTVWKTGVKVDNTKAMLGTFSPQAEPYQHVMPEETTPSGIFARGTYSARTKFVDDDNKCYLEINYTFDIRKNWQ